VRSAKSLHCLAGPVGAWHRFEGGDLLAILAGPAGAWHRFRGGDLLAILAGPMVPGTDSKG
jgi:hypothetical protein